MNGNGAIQSGIDDADVVGDFFEYEAADEGAIYNG
jgi:hypothetical protein